MQVGNLLALDIGEERIGLAVARTEVPVPIGLATLQRQNSQFWSQLKDIIREYEITSLVVGLPRGLNGQETAQTRSVKTFAGELKTELDLPIAWQDEALTSLKAENALRSGGKDYEKADIDALAATYILSDYLETERPQ